MMIYECLMPMLMLCKSSYARLTPEVLQRPALALACSLPHLSSPLGPLVTGPVGLCPFLSPSLGHGPSRSPAVCVWPAQQQKPPAHLLTLSATLAPLSSTPIGGAPCQLYPPPSVVTRPDSTAAARVFALAPTSCLAVPPTPPCLIKAEAASRRPPSHYSCPSTAAASSSQRRRRRLPLCCTVRRFPSFHATVSCLVGFAIISSCSLYFSRAKPRHVGPSLITPARSRFSRPWRCRPCQHRRPHLLFFAHSRPSLIQRSQIEDTPSPAVLLKSPYGFRYLNPSSLVSSKVALSFFIILPEVLG